MYPAPIGRGIRRQLFSPTYLSYPMTLNIQPAGYASHVIAIGLFLSLVLAVSGPAVGQARQVSLDELTAASSDVVLGAVSAKQSFWNADRTRISTEVRLRVTDRIKGDAAEETVVVIPGGQVGNTLYDVSDMPIFVEGEEVLVFLWKHPSGRHTVAGAAQGKLRVLRNEAGESVLEPGASHLLVGGVDDALDKARPPGAAGDALPLARGHVRLDEFVRAVKRVERE